MIIHHVTLLTGHCATHRLDLVSPAAVETCRKLLAGGPIPGFPPWRVEAVGPVFSIHRGKAPALLCGIGRGNDTLWQELCLVQEDFHPVVATAPNSLWLGVVILPPFALVPDETGWLGDFERCMAAAMLLPKAKGSEGPKSSAPQG